MISAIIKIYIHPLAVVAYRRESARDALYQPRSPVPRAACVHRQTHRVLSLVKLLDSSSPRSASPPLRLHPRRRPWLAVVFAAAAAMSPHTAAAKYSLFYIQLWMRSGPVDTPAAARISAMGRLLGVAETVALVHGKSQTSTAAVNVVPARTGAMTGRTEWRRHYLIACGGDEWFKSDGDPFIKCPNDAKYSLRRLR